uniref:Elongin-C n=1 Tax=Steinernema glaseri TaxID=37863 RepID=A0A1I7YGM6_9BILA
MRPIFQHQPNDCFVSRKRKLQDGQACPPLKKRIFIQEEPIRDPVTLVSAEEEMLVLERVHAEEARTLVEMLSGPRGEDTTLHLPLLRMEILEVVAKFLKHNFEARNGKTVGNFQVPPHLAQEFRMAANFLEC